MSEQRQYAPVRSASQQGASPSGRGRVEEVPEAEVRNYYGRSVLKEPTWTWEIPVYFFTGGLAGASADLALVARLSGNDGLARRALLCALGGAAVSPILLISDLGRPLRFYEMLRVVKPTSPMSVGTWVLSFFGASIGAAVASDLLGVLPRLGRVAEGGAALLGPALSTYTAVLIADTSVPVWHEARRELPFVFAASSAASAGAAAAMLASVEDAGPARRLAVGGALLEIGAAEAMKRRLGPFLAEPYGQEAGRHDKLATALSGLGAAVVGLAGRRSRKATVAGGAMILAGAVLERWSIYKAGFQSSRDPKYTVMPQRERLSERDGAERDGANGGS
ncbi:MAG: polysulfide reductase NrfD [Actinomycetota bacterium]|nr:polysulfide reductase NrfD [Actinomycetota bacterium]